MNTKMTTPLILSNEKEAVRRRVIHALSIFKSDWRYWPGWLFFRLNLPFIVRDTMKDGLILPPLEEMHLLPEGTLGKALANYLTDNKLLFISVGPRRVQIHDIFHYMLGYGTDPAGEHKLQAWFLGSKNPKWYNLMPCIYFTLRRLNLRDAFAAFRRGRAQQIDPDSFPAETLIHLPLEEVRSRYFQG